MGQLIGTTSLNLLSWTLPIVFSCSTPLCGKPSPTVLSLHLWHQQTENLMVFLELLSRWPGPGDRHVHPWEAEVSSLPVAIGPLHFPLCSEHVK